MKAKVRINAEHGRYRQFEGVRQNAQGPGPRETIWTLPGNLGEGFFRRFDLPGGSSISISRCKMKKHYRAEVEEAGPSLALVFVQTGNTSTANTRLPRKLTASAGQGYIHYLPDPLLKREAEAGQILNAVALKIPLDRLAALTGDLHGILPDELLRVLNGDRDASYFRKISLTPAMRMALRQIERAPRHGPACGLFLNSKLLELLAYGFEQITGAGNSAPERASLRAGDMERAERALALLRRDLQDPPSLNELARNVGTSHAKLNRIFRKAYGCTVYGMVRRQRLEMAADLLAQDRMSITDIAYAAGFCSSSHFANSFLKRFGMQPSVFRRQALTSGRIAAV